MDIDDYRVGDASFLWHPASIGSSLIIFINIVAVVMTSGWGEYSAYAYLYVPLVAWTGINLGNFFLYRKFE